MLKFAPCMTLLDLAAAALIYVQFRRMMADREMGYLIAKIEPAISGGSCALGRRILHATWSVGLWKDNDLAGCRRS